MSDQPLGQGWWQASDGRWYPPEQHPGHAPLPPPTPAGPPPATVPAGPPTSMPPPADGPTPQPGGTPGRPWWTWLLVGGGVLILILVLAAVVGTVGQNRPDGEMGTAPASLPDVTVPPAPDLTFPPATDEVAAPPDVTATPESDVTVPPATDEVAALPDVTVPPAPDSTFPPATDEVAAPPASGPAGAPDEVDDVGPCVLVDGETIVLEVANNSSKQSSYVIDVNFLDEAGQRVGDELFFVDHVRPGERTVEESFVFDSRSGVSCEIAEVERFATESPDDVTEVSCEIVGEDFVGDVAVVFNATNGSSKLSDYSIAAALVRDGVRAGTAWGFIENVRPGESAPGDGFSIVPGPAAGFECDVVHVQRTASE